jgi:four helix bundle protein
MSDFKNLRVWMKAHDLTVRIYRATRVFPREELFGLTSQMRRSAASIGANIAEGCGRRSDGEFARFLNIARGSAVELEYHVLLAHDLELLSDGAFLPLSKEIDEVQRMLTALVQQVQPSRTMRPQRVQNRDRFGVARGS